MPITNAVMLRFIYNLSVSMLVLIVGVDMKKCELNF